MTDIEEQEFEADAKPWEPDLYPRQKELLEACLPGDQNIVLANGPRQSSKTWGCYHAAIQHGWIIPNANFCVLTITQGAGTDSGPWEHLTQKWLPQWIEAGFGMEWHKAPYTEAVSKKPKCKIVNGAGGVSTFSLESLKDEREVEEKFKGKVYSGIWINELSKFKSLKTFTTLWQCLRDYPKNQLLFLADTNPDLDLGQESWIYKLWYLSKNANFDELKKMYPDLEDPTILLPLFRKLKLIEFTVGDNLSMSEDDKQVLMASFAHDKDLLDAYFYGKWVTASTDALFYRQFRPMFHCVGDPPTKDNLDPDIMVPQPGCAELITGWDPGDSINSAAVIATKWWQTMKFKTPEGKEVERKLPVIGYLDEVVWTGQPHSLDELVFELMEKMMFWELQCGLPGAVRWRHWSDRSVFDRLSPESQRYLYQIIFDASVMFIAQKLSQGETPPKEPILLEAAERGPGTVGQRVDLTRRLLFGERMFFNKLFYYDPEDKAKVGGCPRLIESIRGLKRGNTTVTITIARGTPLKHAWDAALYLAAQECYDELSSQVLGHLMNMRKSTSGGSLVSVPM